MDIRKSSLLPSAMGSIKSKASGQKNLEVFYMFNDKTLTCKDCGQEFTFSASEQEFFAEKGFTNEPGRCSSCRAIKKQQTRGGNSGYGREPREMFPAVCATCGKETTVPFQPSGDKPVYCRDCYQPRQRSNW